MNDNEIIKEATEALEQNLGAGSYVGDLLNIINRLQAENERLTKLLDDKCDRCIARDKAEAYKEIIKEHKKIMREFLDDDNEFLMKWCEYETSTDNLLKEKVGDGK